MGERDEPRSKKLSALHISSNAVIDGTIVVGTVSNVT